MQVYPPPAAHASFAPAYAPAPSSGDNRIDEWLALERDIGAAMARGPGVGVVRREDAARLDGITLLRGMLQGEHPYPPIAQTLGFGLVAVEPGLAVFQGQPKPAHLNPMGGVHGGWYATLLDSALGCAVHTLMPAGRGYTTAELSIRLVRAVGLEVPRVRAIGQVVHAGRQMATAEARLVGPDGRLYAHGSTTCLVFELSA
jgi:uncharacterized protein (TIGR00369 family)